MGRTWYWLVRSQPRSLRLVLAGTAVAGLVGYLGSNCAVTTGIFVYIYSNSSLNISHDDGGLLDFLENGCEHSPENPISKRRLCFPENN